MILDRASGRWHFPRWPTGAIPPVRLEAYGDCEQASGRVARLGVLRFDESGALSFAVLEREMSLFRGEPKDRSMQTGLASVLAVVVLFATVNFYRFFRYFPA